MRMRSYKTSEWVENRAEEEDEGQEEIEETNEVEEASGDDQVEDEDLPEEGKNNKQPEQVGSNSSWHIQMLFIFRPWLLQPVAFSE